MSKLKTVHMNRQIFIFCCLSALLAGCSESTKHSQGIVINNNNISLDLDSRMAALSVSKDNLIIEALLTSNKGEQRVTLELSLVTITRIEGKLPGIYSAGSYQLQLFYFYSDPEYGKTPIFETAVIANIIVTDGGTTNADFVRADMSELDSDNDGFLSIDEIAPSSPTLRTDPLDTFKFPGNPAILSPQHSPTLKASVGKNGGKTKLLVIWPGNTESYNNSLYMSRFEGISKARYIEHKSAQIEGNMKHDGIHDPMGRDFSHLGALDTDFWIMITRNADGIESAESAQMFFSDFVLTDEELINLVPNDITITAYTDSIELKWSPASAQNAEYTVHVSSEPNFINSLTVGTTTDTRMVHRDNPRLVPGVMNYYMISTNSSDGGQSASSQVVGAETYGILDPVSGVEITEGNNILTVSWPDYPLPTGAEINIYIRDAGSTADLSNCDSSELICILNVDTTLTDNNGFINTVVPGLANDQTYSVRVEVKDRYGRKGRDPVKLSGTPH